MLSDIRSNHPFVFGGGTRHRPHHKRYSEFSKKWGFQGIVMAQAKEDFTRIKEIEESNLLEFLFFMEWLYEGAEVDEIEREYQDNLRKAKRGK